MSDWDGSLDEHTNEDVVDEAPTEEPSLSDDSSGVDAPVEQTLYAGKYKSLEEFEKGYKELERQFHERNQPAPEPEYEEPEWVPGFASEEAQQIAQYAAQGAEYAKQAFEYATENAATFGLDASRVRNELFQMWQIQDPIGAQQHLVQQQIDQIRAAMQQEIAPLQQQYDTQIITLAVEKAAAELPGFAERADQVLNHIQSVPGLTDAINKNPAYKNPEMMRNFLEHALAQVMYAEHVAQVRAQANDADTAKQAPAKPKTQNRSTTTKPASDDIFADLFGEDAFAA